VPEVDVKFFKVIVHHFWFGVILAIAGFVIPKQKIFPKILLYGIGIGLIVDQLIFMILGAGNDKEYWALPSLLGMIILVSILYPIRTKLTNILIE